MKRFNKIYIGASLSMLLLMACNKQLDLKPYQQVDQSSAIRTAQDVQVTLVGAYNRAGIADLYGGGVFLYGDLQGTQADINWQGTFQGLTQMVVQEIAIDDSFVDGTWSEGYQVINAANNVLANINLVASTDKDRTQGEAEFLRGMTYFDLARLFGRDWNDGTPTANPAVPIILTPTTSLSSASYVARSTVAQVYAQAISDLKDAEAKLPADNSFFANKYAAAAILSRLYMQQRDYADAITEATTVINSGQFALNKNYSDEFPYPNGTAVHVDNTAEDIFALQVTSQAGTNALNTYYASSYNAGRGDIIVQDSFVAGFEAGDARAGMYNQDPDGVLRCDKFDNTFGNVHVIRLAEMYLNRAEANIQAGTTTGATPLADINVIRARAQLKPLTTVTITNVLDETVHELAFENGLFLYNKKRLATLLSGQYPASFQQTVDQLPPTSPKLVFPIPEIEINANPKLVQNPGY
ncbi:MAG TPA: RagB/SusD family nutrient uptake outer membrane protein [Mucilaginibacter sp.]|nr:RagB/SusD family nutrient uptake outer membrane protein [Mucilaginibacter sp.]